MVCRVSGPQRDAENAKNLDDGYTRKYRIVHNVDFVRVERAQPNKDGMCWVTRMWKRAKQPEASQTERKKQQLNAKLDFSFAIFTYTFLFQLNSTAAAVAYFSISTSSSMLFLFSICVLSLSLFVYTHTMRATAVKCRSVSHSDVLMQCTICTHTHTPRPLCLSVGPPCDGCLLFFFCLVLFILLCYTHRLLSAPSLCVINTRARKSENKR